MRVLLYGRLAEAIAPEVDLKVDGPCTVRRIREQLARNHQIAAETLMSEHSRAVVAGSLASEEQMLTGDATIEFLPPVSGG